jgi:hypothetical protein
MYIFSFILLFKTSVEPEIPQVNILRGIGNQAKRDRIHFPLSPNIFIWELFEISILFFFVEG